MLGRAAGQGRKGHQGPLGERWGGRQQTNVGETLQGGRREEGAEEGGDCGAWPRKAHILGRAAVTRRGLTLHE